MKVGPAWIRPAGRPRSWAAVQCCSIPSGAEVAVRGTVVALPPKEFSLLEALLARKGRLVTREALLAEVWAPEYFGDTKTLGVHVQRLRAKIEGEPGRPKHLIPVRVSATSSSKSPSADGADRPICLGTPRAAQCARRLPPTNGERPRMRLKFIPREKAFFGLFQQGAANLVAGARLLKDMVDRYDDPKASYRAIVDAEHRGDDITHEIIRKLNTTFVTPLDREDIHALASGIDDVMDFIEAAADIFVLHGITEPSPTSRAQTDVLLRACEAVKEGVDHLEGFKDLEKYWILVNEIENEGDKLFRRAVADLFNGSFKAMDVLKWKEIYDQIEAAIDGCENIANILEAVVLKHA
jgi:hypothetical protein